MDRFILTEDYMEVSDEHSASTYLDGKDYFATVYEHRSEVYIKIVIENDKLKAKVIKFGIRMDKKTEIRSKKRLIKEMQAEVKRLEKEVNDE